jgi:hypothetical protein
MKKFLFFSLLFVSISGVDQDVSILLKEASNFERLLKENEALEKYNQVLSADTANLTSLIKAAQLSAAIGGRQQDKAAKKTYYEAAKRYADKAYAANASSADVNYTMSLAASKLAEVETENKKLAAYVRDIKVYADKALAIDPNNARANYAAGKWHADMVEASWVKKAAAKALFGGLPEAKIEDAFYYFEKCRSIDQYFVANYFELGKAYKFDNKPAKAIEIFQKLVKLPTRTADDAALKAEGKKLLDSML